jgi:CRISPR-associated protein Cas8a1/Csx13
MTATSTQPKIYLHLDASDTTLIHRAGILGLWMTLKQLEKRFPHPSQRLGKLSWELTPNSISLDWEGQDEAVLDWILKEAFQIDERGLISLTGLNPQSMSLINRVHLQEVLSKTLLQYNKNLTSIASKYKGLGIKIERIAPYLFLKFLINFSLPWQFYLLLDVSANDANHSVSFKIDGVELSLQYKQLASYVYQDFSKRLCDPKTHQWTEKYIPIVSWLYPGAIVRHEEIREYSQCKEPPKYAFVLLFLPIACHYLILSKEISQQIKLREKRLTKYLLVIPDPINLEESAKIRWRLNRTKYKDLYVSSLGEAALSYYSKEINHNFCFQRCRVILYGKLMQSSHLNSPVDIQDFTITKRIFKKYKLTAHHLQDNALSQVGYKFLIKVNLIRGMICDNLLKQESIWQNLWSTLKYEDSYREIRQQLELEGQGLFTVIKNIDEITKAHNAFIEIIHEALKQIYAKIYEENREAGTASQKIARENEQLKLKLLNCYKEETFREIMAKLLARANNLSSLNENRILVLPILTGKMDWKESRDITLFALSSYPIQAKMSRELLVFFAFPLLVDEELYRLGFALL